ncbi:MAG: class I SAM-dependent methyltransferase, partial [Candidatus Kariarchaeaceae archaeon]
MKDYDAFGEIFLDHHRNNQPVHYSIEREDGYINAMDSSLYFNDSTKWHKDDLELLKFVKEPILDIGCGAGRHSLYLQEKGFDVMALDNSPKAIKVCQERGIKKTKIGSIFGLTKLKDTYSTFLMFGNNINLAGSYYGNIGFFQELTRLANENARIIGTYRSPVPTNAQYHLDYHEINRTYGNPIGQTVIRVRYKHLYSQWVPFYLPTQQEFREILNKSGWILLHEA